MELKEIPYPVPGVGVVIMHPTREFHIVMGVRKGGHGAGEWMIPGGKIEKWSTGPKTAVEEVKEETGLDIEVVNMGGKSLVGNEAFEDAIALSTGDYFRDDELHFVTMYYAAKIVGEEIEPKVMEPEKCEKWIWHDIREPIPEPFFLPLQKVINSLMERVDWQWGWIPQAGEEKT